MATRRMELWATFANTALRSSLKREDPSLAAPSGEGEGGGGGKEEEESSRQFNVKFVSYNDQGPPPVCLPSVFLTPRMWYNLLKPSSSVFAYCKRSKTGGGSGQG